MFKSKKHDSTSVSSESPHTNLAGGKRYNTSNPEYLRKLDLNLLLSRKTIAYGATLEFTLSLYNSDFKPVYIIDDTQELQGRSLAGIPIFSPQKLQEEDYNDIIVVICASKPNSIHTISHKLDGLGLQYGRHYIESSFLHYDSVATRLRKIGVEPTYTLFTHSRLLHLYSSLQNLSQPAGTWIMAELLKHFLPNIPGHVAECGVYNGGNAFCQLLLCPLLQERTYHLLDSFKGFPQLSESDPDSRANDFTDVDLREVERAFHCFTSVKIHPGYFKDTLPSLKDEHFSFVYIDCDLYEPTLQCIDFFYPRLSEGGILFFHDYGLPEVEWPTQAKANFWGTHKAVQERFSSHQIITFPETTHALVFK